MFPTLVEKWEEIEYTPKAASTVIPANGFLTYDGSGGAIPATAGDPILGLNGESITAADSDYASTRQIPYQVARGFRFKIPVTTGTATEAMVGLPFDLADEFSLDVSAPGTQFVVREFVATDMVVVEAIDLA